MRHLPVLLFVFFSFIGWNQNLVPNGDFETYSYCPDNHDQLGSVAPWYSPNNNSSDYFNACATYIGVGFNPDVPTNTHGYQLAHSGSGYIGLNMVPPIGYFEYATVRLSQTLTAGQQYCVSFWVSLSDASCWSTNLLGLHFSYDSLYTSSNHIDFTPTIQFPEFVDQKEDWVNLQIIHNANGGENFLTLGIFNDDNIETIQFCEEPYAVNGSYYFIDDVSVELLTEESPCSGKDTFGEEDISNVVTPNNDGVNDLWTLTTLNDHELIILNRWGNVVYQNTGAISAWDASKVNDGVYFYSIQYKGEEKHGFIHVIK